MIFIRDPNLKSVTQTLKEFKDKKSKTKEKDQLIKSYGIGAQIIKSLKIKKMMPCEMCDNYEGKKREDNIYVCDKCEKEHPSV